MERMVPVFANVRRGGVATASDVFVSRRVQRRASSLQDLQHAGGFCCPDSSDYCRGVFSQWSERLLCLRTCDSNDGSFTLSQSSMGWPWHDREEIRGRTNGFTIFQRHRCVTVPISIRGYNCNVSTGKTRLWRSHIHTSPTQYNFYSNRFFRQFYMYSYVTSNISIQVGNQVYLLLCFRKPERGKCPAVDREKLIATFLIRG